MGLYGSLHDYIIHIAHIIATLHVPLITSFQPPLELTNITSTSFYYPVDISTTVFSYSHAVQYHTILHGAGVIARVLLHGPWGYAVS